MFITKNTNNKVEQIAYNLYSKLSPLYYPQVPTLVYDIFLAYATILKNLQEDIQQTEADLSVYTASPNVLQRNFGSLLRAKKNTDQLNNNYNSNELIQSYRIFLLLLIDSIFAEGSRGSIKYVGWALSGVSPIIFSSKSQLFGWKLSEIAGEVLATGQNLIVLNSLDNRGNQIVIDYYGSSPPPVGSRVRLGTNKLGVSTKIFSKVHHYQGIDLVFFGKEKYLDIFKNLINNVTFVSNRVYTVRASQSFKFWRPELHGFNGQKFSLHPYGFLESLSGEQEVVECETTTLELTNDDLNYFYYFDFLVRTFNDAKVSVEVKSYNSSSFPKFVYYQRIKEKPTSKLTTLYGQKGIYATVTPLGLFRDIARGYVFNIIDATYDELTLRRDRGQTKACIFTTTDQSYVRFSADVTGSELDFIAPLTMRFFANGVDSNKSMFLGITCYDRTTTYDGFGQFDPTFKGYSFFVSSNKLKLFIMNALNSAQQVEIDISDLVSELPSRWHMFLVTILTNGTAQFYIDDQLVYETIVQQIPSFDNKSVVIELMGSNLGIDEVVIDNYFMTNDLIRHLWDFSKPDIIQPFQLKEKYWKAKFTVEKANPREVQIHQFSMKRAYFTFGDDAVPPLDGYGYRYGTNYGIGY